MLVNCTLPMQSPAERGLCLAFRLPVRQLDTTAAWSVLDRIIKRRFPFVCLSVCLSLSLSLSVPFRDTRRGGKTHTQREKLFDFGFGTNAVVMNSTHTCTSTREHIFHFHFWFWFWFWFSFSFLLSVRSGRAPCSRMLPPS